MANAVLTNAGLTINLSWSQNQSDIDNPGNTLSSAGAFSYSRAWQSGTGGVPAGYTAAGQVWNLQATIPAGSYLSYNVSGLATPSFSGSYLTSFKVLKCLYVENLTAYSGADITIYTVGVTGLSGLFNGGSGNMRIAGGSPWMFVNYVTGIPIGGTPQQNTCFILNDIAGSGCQVRIGMVGI